MTRSLVLGNGRFFLNFDDQYRIRDVFFPRLGIENHSEGRAFRLGVSADGATHWVDAAWERRIGYDAGSLVGLTVLTHEGLGLELTLRDAIDFEADLYCREIAVRELAGRARDVRVFLHHDFYISGTEVGDTALYDPDLGSLIHYKRDRYFLIGGGTPPSYRLSSFATGKKGVGGAEGTWRDAEQDGRLSEHPIVQGSVDSTLALDVKLAPSGEARTYYWIGAGERYGDVLALDERVRQQGPRSFIDRTRAYWRLWLDRPGREFHALPDDLLALYRTSLLVMRAHVDHGGAIIAATDSDITQFARDTYAYMWPRDGALIAHAFDHAGQPAVSRRFFTFVASLLKKEGYFLHKYHPDRSLASSWHPWLDEGGERILPIQEDETGLVVWALWKHFERWGDVEFVQPMYRPFVLRAALFMESYRDHATGLPLPSWDLWEERRGVLTFTCATVWAGLDAAARFAAAFGDDEQAERFGRAAADVREGVLRHLWDEDEGRFLRMLVPAEQRSDGREVRDATPDSSLFLLHKLAFLDTDDPRLVATLEAVASALRVDTDIGGLARYRGDTYHAVTNDWDRVPGNPWFIAQCWLAQWRMARAATPLELEAALGPLSWVARHAALSGMLPEQLQPYTGEHLSVAPLAWSHAAYVSAVHEYLDRRDRLAACPECGAPPSEARMSSMERALR